MKKLYTILVAVLLSATTFLPQKASAQAPEKMSYQAVVRNSSGLLISNQAVGMQISILQTTPMGTAVYVETHTPITNVNGLVTLEIGSGTVISGNFTTIDWSIGSYFIKTETDPTGGTTYTITGTSQLMSVPYAMHAKTSDNVANSALKFNTTSGSGIQSETNTAIGAYSTAMGRLTTASGYAALATGFQTTASGKESTAMGLLTTASGDYSTAIGTELNSSEFYSTAIGKYNATMVANTAFAIGNGSSGALSNAVTVLFDGTTTIAGPVTATSFSGDGSSLTNLPTELPTNAYTGDMSYWNGSSWSVIAATPNEGATLQMIGGVPTWTGGTPPPPAAVGDIRYGGVVFWVDPADNTHGLVCALSDSSSLEEWGCYGTDLPNVPNVDYNGGNPVGLGAEIGDGINNTNTILNDCSTAPPALAARLAGNEWFLPSINELNEIYLNRAILEAVPGFVGFQSHYWSSTEINNNYAWRLRFDTGTLYSTIKNATFNYARAVRAF